MGYSWPLQPFDRAHPVRGFFNDPRISGATKAFHFGVDISAPNGTPVYAVAAGQVHLEDARAISVAAGDVDFGYWHVVPVVRHREVVARHQLLGHIEAPWLHQAGASFVTLNVSGSSDRTPNVRLVTFPPNASRCR